MAQSTQTYEWEAKQRSPDREGGLATTPATISMTSPPPIQQEGGF